MKRVVVTGMGAVHPFGVGVPSLWEAIREGRNGVREIKHFDTSAYYCHVAAYLDGFRAEDYLDRKLIVMTDPFQQIGMVATLEALRDAGMKEMLDGEDAYRVGVVGGSNNGGIATYLREGERFFARGFDRVTPFFISKISIDMLAGHIAIQTGAMGPNIGMTASCATGTIILGMGSRLIQCGDADTVICTAAEVTVYPIAIAAFCRMRALAKMWPADPARSMRPFDRGRSGTIFGDGAACLILESLESATRRGARVYAEVAGFGMSDDAYHVTAPDPSADGPYHCIRAALNNAGLAPNEIEYINAHGTGTPYNDVMETTAIKRVFGEHARRMPISSTKSMHGHMIASTGAMEAILTIKTITEGIIPPTINLEEPDPECDLDYVPRTPRRQTVRTAMSNNFGFGGHNGSIVFKAHPG